MADQPQVDVSPRTLANWGLANAMAQKFGSEAAAIRKAYPDAEVAPLPFGSQVTNTTNISAGMSRWAQLGLVAMAMGGAGLGAAGMLREETKQTETRPAVTAPERVASDAAKSTAPAAAEPQIIEGVLDWETTEGGELRIDDIRRAD